MAPSGEAVAVAVEALRRDAQEWCRWAETLDAAARLAAELDLSANEMCGLSELAGLPALYGAVQRRAVALALAGAGQFVAVAEALRSAADGYEADERMAVHRLLGLW